jgi:gas vesicle protein
VSGTLTFIVGTLVSVLLVAAITVGTWAGLRTGKTAQTLANFRNAAESWQASAEAQAAEITQLKTQLGEALARIATQDTKIAVMQEMVTGTNAMAALRAEVLEEFRLTRELIAKGAG